MIVRGGYDHGFKEHYYRIYDPVAVINIVVGLIKISNRTIEVNGIVPLRGMSTP